MTQIKKQTLIKEICTRIPYGVKILYDKGHKGRKFTNGLICQPSGLTKVGDKTYITAFGVNEPIDIEDVRIILRPMSSITKKEMFDFHKNGGLLTHNFKWDVELDILTVGAIDWLNKYHFDYRWLIPMDLAIESTEGIYK